MSPPKPAYASLPVHQRLGLDGEPLETLVLPISSLEPFAGISDFETVGSYSWVDTEKPVLCVPAAPPATKFTLPIQIPADSSPKIIDQQALKLPRSPLEPVVQATRLLSPSFNFSALQIVTDRSNLRKLFGAVRGSINAWRTDAELAGDGTMLLTKQELGTMDHFGEEFKGYDVEFHRAQTSAVEGCDEMGSHFRMSTYQLGGLKLLVRYNVDGQRIKSLPRPRKFEDLDNLRLDDASPPPPAPPPPSPNDRIPNLETFFLSHPQTDVPIPFGSSSLLSYQVSNTSIPLQSSLVEIKTRPGHKPSKYKVAKAWDQLYFSQTPILYTAFYDRKGRFKKLQRFSLFEGAEGKPGGPLVEFEEEGKREVGKVVEVLKQMREIVVREGKLGRGVSFVFEDGELKVWRTKEEERTRLDEGLLALF